VDAINQDEAVAAEIHVVHLHRVVDAVGGGFVLHPQGEVKETADRVRLSMRFTEAAIRYVCEQGADRRIGALVERGQRREFGVWEGGHPIVGDPAELVPRDHVEVGHARALTALRAHQGVVGVLKVLVLRVEPARVAKADGVPDLMAESLPEDARSARSSDDRRRAWPDEGAGREGVSGLHDEHAGVVTRGDAADKGVLLLERAQRDSERRPLGCRAVRLKAHKVNVRQLCLAVRREGECVGHAGHAVHHLAHCIERRIWDLISIRDVHDEQRPDDCQRRLVNAFRAVMGCTKRVDTSSGGARTERDGRYRPVLAITSALVVRKRHCPRERRLCFPDHSLAICRRIDHRSIVVDNVANLAHIVVGMVAFGLLPGHV